MSIEAQRGNTAYTIEITMRHGYTYDGGTFEKYGNARANANRHADYAMDHYFDFPVASIDIRYEDQWNIEHRDRVYRRDASREAR